MQIMKRVRTETAHRLYPYEGDCAQIHGHSYIFEVTIDGESNKAMLMDFKDLKKILQDKLVDFLDHKLVLYRGDPDFATFSQLCDNVVGWPAMPTAESFAKCSALVIVSELAQVIDFQLTSVEVKVWETADSCATYKEIVV